MQFRLDRFFLDEKDLFVFGYLALVIIVGILKIPIEPLRYGSLVVVLVFLLATRSLVSFVRFNVYFFIILSGLIFSLFLSPYGVAIYLFLAMALYAKTNRI
ncbi:hypothetical protein A3F03_00805 [Candidatus Roizmanbacteria bacterium RIFCSPHIGHO2_12_FULL_41_11]|uniref:Uncharacterized protein n=1 Tax=Candidatus Roizmanbacteria bacterium RIFCSPHIGHO2_12_FULL_41_11 TaxID=1802052 RepID=A0A1F7I3P9_9BACT|nr:MAG: hypothetical protein A3F03_00805 [Candidatus Roizmanbacteria bacterium RIFCSPHIGHO2_12_FULL_41_11]